MQPGGTGRYQIGVLQLLPVQHGGHRGVPVQPAAREVLRKGDQQDGALRGASQT